MVSPSIASNPISASPSSRRLVGVLSERTRVGQCARGLGHIGAFPPQIFVDRTAQAGIGDVVRRTGGLRKISTRDLVFALRTGLDGSQASPNGEIDGLIIANFEVQEWMVLDRAPVAT